jgi:hypothetical protein
MALVLLEAHTRLWVTEGAFSTTITFDLHADDESEAAIMRGVGDLFKAPLPYVCGGQPVLENPMRTMVLLEKPLI